MVVPPSSKTTLEMFTGLVVLYTVPLCMISCPPSLSIVAPKTAVLFVIAVAVGFESTGAETEDVVALVVCAPVVK